MDRRFIHLSFGLIICTAIAAGAWMNVRLHETTSIDVRGSAKRRIASDFAEWEAVVSSAKKTRVEAYSALKTDIESVRAFLKTNGVPEKEIRVSAAELNELSHEESTVVGDKVLEKKVFDGWQASQHVDVSSNDVPRVERLSREATQLLENGIAITSEPPHYHYTKAGDLKIEMLSEAAHDARTRAERMIDSAGGGAKVGHIETIDTGVVNINAANSTNTSWEGNYDTSSFEKDIITTVRVRFSVRY